MKFILIFSMLLPLSLRASEIEKVVYGDDNREDVYLTKNPLLKELSRSTAGMISTSNLVDRGDSIHIEGGTLEGDGVCSDARFAKQQTSADCSGFLVGNQYLVTAGHCIKTLEDCDRYSWVFGYGNETEEKSAFVVSKSDVYKCVELTEHELNRSTQNDYSLVKLDRPVTGRTPLKLRKKGKPAAAINLVVIGHPSGLPTKISDGGKMRDNKNAYFFQTNLDTFGGNSGSAVFNTATGLVEGILVRGETDYVRAEGENCSRPKVCAMNECRGEDVTRITNIKTLLKPIRR